MYNKIYINKDCRIEQKIGLMTATSSCSINNYKIRSKRTENFQTHYFVPLMICMH